MYPIGSIEGIEDPSPFLRRFVSRSLPTLASHGLYLNAFIRNGLRDRNRNHITRIQVLEAANEVVG
jgi:hypothetical protein